MAFTNSDFKAIPGYRSGTPRLGGRTFAPMPPRLPAALVLALALLAGVGALVPSAAGAMSHGAMAQGEASTEATRACCLPGADPCKTPCPPDDERSIAEAVLCCASGAHDVPREAAVAPEAPTRLTAVVALAAAWAVAPSVPPAPLRPGGADRYGPPRPPVRSHLAVSVLLI